MVLFISTELKGIFKGPKISHLNYEFLKGTDRYITVNFRHTYSISSSGINRADKKLRGYLNSNDLRVLAGSVQINAVLDSASIDTIVTNINSRVKELTNQT